MVSVEPYVYVRNANWKELMDIVKVEDVERDQVERLFEEESLSKAFPENLQDKVFIRLDNSDLLIPIMRAANREKKNYSFYIVFLNNETLEPIDAGDIDEITLKLWLKDNPQPVGYPVIEPLDELGSYVVGVNLMYSTSSVLAGMRWVEKLSNFVIARKIAEGIL